MYQKAFYRKPSSKPTDKVLGDDKDQKALPNNCGSINMLTTPNPTEPAPRRTTPRPCSLRLYLLPGPQPEDAQPTRQEEEEIQKERNKQALQVQPHGKEDNANDNYVSTMLLTKLMRATRKLLRLLLTLLRLCVGIRRRPMQATLHFMRRHDNAFRSFDR
eukprot:2404196-Amphidinium_carterae.1